MTCLPPVPLLYTIQYHTVYAKPLVSSQEMLKAWQNARALLLDDAGRFRLMKVIRESKLVAKPPTEICISLVRCRAAAERPHLSDDCTIHTLPLRPFLEKKITSISAPRLLSHRRKKSRRSREGFFFFPLLVNVVPGETLRVIWGGF